MRKLKRIQEPRNHIQYIVHPEVREELKPLVFFDAGNMTRNDDGLMIHEHPHSGIGIVTYFHGTDLYHGDSGDNDGIIRAGGVQWIRAGGGVWHQENYRRMESNPEGSWEASIHQLWLQLPPEFEESEVEYKNLQPEQVPSIENVKVVIGEYKDVKGQINPPFEMTYLDIHLEEGEEFEMETPENQTKGFVYARYGSLEIDGEEVPNQRMGVLEQGSGNIQVKSLTGPTDLY